MAKKATRRRLLQSLWVGSVLLLATAGWAQKNPRFEEGLSLLKDKKYKEAAAVYEDLCWRSSLTRENQGRCYGNLSEAYLHQRKYDDAIRYADRAISLGDQSSYARKAAAYLHGKYDVKEAIRLFRKGTRVSHNLKFYGLTDNVIACHMNDSMNDCVEACVDITEKNGRARIDACKRGFKWLEDRCQKGDKEACDRRCHAKYNTKGAGLFAGWGLSTGSLTSCRKKDQIEQNERKQRLESCRAGSILDCRAACTKDLVGAACEHEKGLLVKRAAERAAACIMKDDVESCKLSCRDDANLKPIPGVAPAQLQAMSKGSCTHLDKVLEAKRVRLSNACDGGDGQACHDAAVFVKEESRGQPLPLALRGCELKHAASCTLATTLAANDTDKRTVEDTKCKNNDVEACRAWARMALQGKGGPTESQKGGALLAKHCKNGDRASCDAHLELLKNSEPQRARQLLDERCDDGDTAACVALAEAFAGGTWLSANASAVNDIHDKVCTSDNKTSDCRSIESAMRRNDIHVPGDPIQWPFDLDVTVEALAGIDTNPFHSNSEAMEDPNLIHIVGFTFMPEATAKLHGGFNFAYGLGPVRLRLGADLVTHHFATADPGMNATSGALTWFAPDAKANAGIGLTLGPIVVDVDDHVRAAHLPGRDMPVNEDLVIPTMTARRGMSTTTLDNRAQARVKLNLVDWIDIQGRYQYWLARHFWGAAIDGVDDIQALTDVNRFMGPGDVAVPYNGPAGMLDRDQHRGEFSLDVGLEELMDMEDLFVTARAYGGVTFLHDGQYIPVGGAVGARMGVEGIDMFADLGFAYIKLPNTARQAFIWNMGLRFNESDMRVTMAFERKFDAHPLYTQAMSDLLSIEGDFTLDDGILMTTKVSAGTVLLGDAQGNLLVYILDIDETGWLADVSTKVSYPLGMLKLTTEAGLLFWTSPTSPATFGRLTDVGQLRVLGGVAW